MHLYSRITVQMLTEHVLMHAVQMVRKRKGEKKIFTYPTLGGQTTPISNEVPNLPISASLARPWRCLQSERTKDHYITYNTELFLINCTFLGGSNLPSVTLPQQLTKAEKSPHSLGKCAKRSPSTGSLPRNQKQIMQPSESWLCKQLKLSWTSKCCCRWW